MTFLQFFLHFLIECQIKFVINTVCFSLFFYPLYPFSAIKSVDIFTYLSKQLFATNFKRSFTSEMYIVIDLNRV